MDWVSVVFILLFFVLPIVQQIIEHARGQREQPAASEEEEAGWTPRPGQRPSEVEDGPASDAGNWSQGWGTWPDFTPAETAEKEEEYAIEATGPEPTETSDVGYERPRADAPLPPAPVVAPVPSPPSSVAPATREHVTSPTRRASRRTADAWRVRSALRKRGEVRRALILREVLGPPLSIREGGEDSMDGR